MTALSIGDIRTLRLNSLLLADHDYTTAEQVVSWFAAMQAQDLASVKWSLGIRLPELTETDIDEAFERGDILRTWPMRGTIHLIPSRDARWMLEATGTRQLKGVEKRWDYLGLDRATVERAGEVLAGALADGGRLTRAQAATALNEAGIETSSQRLYHLLWHTSQIGITCIGPTIDKEQTFVLLDDWAPDQRELSGEDAITELAWSYIRSHGPVPATDFAGWAGIPVTQARKAFAANDGRAVTVESDFGELWLATDLLERAGEVADRDTGAPDVWALPGFDEFMLGYKDRRAFLDDGHLDLVVPGSNGMFRSTVVVSGAVVGVWKRTISKTKVKVDVEPFKKLTKAQYSDLVLSLERYGRYLGVPIVLS